MKRAAPVLFFYLIFLTAQGIGQTPLPFLDVFLFESKTVSIESDGDIQKFDAETVRSPVTIMPHSPIQFLKVNRKPYRGSIVISPHNESLRVVNHVTLEEYLYGVIGKEMPGASEEALKAQAVASRTLAYNAFLKGNPIHASVTNQVYGGVDAERLVTNQAVDDTRGILLSYQGKPAAMPLFSSTCGGITESSEDVFGKRIPYLTSVNDFDSDPNLAYCNESPYFEWQYSYDKNQIEQMLALKGVHGDLQDLAIAETDPRGHVKTLLVKTSEGEWRFRNFAIRNAVKRPDGKILPSTWFTIEKQSSTFLIKGRGQGHGVGMCQWGAIGMAKLGKDFKAILSHYYPGTEIESLP